MSNRIKFGLIREREVPQVDKYIFSSIDDIANTRLVRAEVVKSLYPYFENNQPIDLYVAGPTVALVEVINICIKKNIPLDLYRYRC